MVEVAHPFHYYLCRSDSGRMEVIMKKMFLFILVTLFLGVSYSSNAAATNASVPVLLYHVVSTNPDPNNQYQYSLTEFKKQMDYLKTNGYTTLSIDQYYSIINKTVSMPSKPVLDRKSVV